MILVPKKPTNDATRRVGPARLSTDIQHTIGSQLRAMYDDVVKQGVPDRFIRLLSQLDERSDKSKG